MPSGDHASAQNPIMLVEDARLTRRNGPDGGLQGEDELVRILFQHDGGSGARPVPKLHLTALA